jgi:enolase
MVAIARVTAREILDCRLESTLRVTVETESGTGTAGVPCGRLRSTYEPIDLRDGGSRYDGLGVTDAVVNVTGVIAIQFAIDADGLTNAHC